MKFKTTCAVVLTALISGVALRNPLQAQSFVPGTIVVNAGVGLGFGGYVGYYSGASLSPVFSLTGEYGLMKLGPGTLGAGLAFGYQRASYTNNYYSYSTSEKWTTTEFGVRGTYHPDFLQSKKYDIYGIVQLSFNHMGYSYTSTGASNTYDRRGDLGSNVRPSLLVGVRYYFTDFFGVYSELGYDLSIIKAGLSFKFNGKGGMIPAVDGK